MASYSQGGGFYAASMRIQDHGAADQAGLANGGKGRHAHTTRFPSDAQSSSRNGFKRSKRPGGAAPRNTRSGPRVGAFVFIVLCIVSITIIGGDHIFLIMRNHTGGHGSFRSLGFLENQDGSTFLSFWNQRTDRMPSKKAATNWADEVNHENDEYDKKKKALQFGEAFVQEEELVDRDSRYWDKDDRVRDRDLDYEDESFNTADANDDSRELNHRETLFRNEWARNTNARKNDDVDDAGVARRSALPNQNSDLESRTKQLASWKRPANGSVGLYNEGGRKELRIYEEQLEAALKQELDSLKAKGGSDLDDEYELTDHDGNIYRHNESNDESGEVNANTNQSNVTEADSIEDSFLEDGDDEYTEDAESATLPEDTDHVKEVEGLSDDSIAAKKTDESMKPKATFKALNGVHTLDGNNKKSQSELQQLSRKSKRRRRTGSPCEINFLETTQGLEEPETDVGFQKFSLKYVDVEYPQGIAGWVPRFAGHQTLAQRNQSFKAEDQTLHCGFVKSTNPPTTSGFDLAEDDVRYLHTCRIAVSSCIFGSSDNVRSPRNRRLTGSFKKDVCFVMFVDQSTLDLMKWEGQQLDEKGFLGPWRVVLVKNLPYIDARRVGKIPKFLTHRLFPAARYSIWLDSKLRLQIDPVLILEYFLWRGGYEYAISNHYDRHCVWEEVQQNKKLNKYNPAAIDEQFAFYKADGLTRFNASNPKKLLPSNVPEGSFIVRAHTPMSNLFSCLWFNEVDRFTSRDQLSFAQTYMKFVRSNLDKHFYFNMFKDCERKSITKLFRHRKSNPGSLDSRERKEVKV